METIYETLGFKAPEVLVNPYGIKIYLGTKGKDDWCIEVPKEIVKKKCPRYPYDYNYVDYLISEERVLEIAREYTRLAQQN